ncbi:hypothetical protein MASR1M8_16070 [Thermomonas brevis]
MSDTYTKLFRSIAASTIVSEPVATRWLWVTMLSQADKAGKVYASVPGLARIANISIAECEEGLRCFMSPDPYSRTSDHEGRRVEAFDGGWRLLNHAKYDAMRNEAERREKKREWDRKNRPSGHQRAKQAASDADAGNGQSDASPAQSDETRQSGPISHSSFPISHQEQQPHSLATPLRASEEQAGAPVTEAGRTCRLLREAGFGATNPSHPHLLLALRAGVTPETIRDTAVEGRDLGKSRPLQWAYATAHSRHMEPAPEPSARAGPRSAPSRTLTAIQTLLHGAADEPETTTRGHTLAGPSDPPGSEPPAVLLVRPATSR